MLHKLWRGTIAIAILWLVWSIWPFVWAIIGWIGWVLTFAIAGTFLSAVILIAAVIVKPSVSEVFEGWNYSDYELERTVEEMSKVNRSKESE